MLRGVLSHELHEKDGVGEVPVSLIVTRLEVDSVGEGLKSGEGVCDAQVGHSLRLLCLEAHVHRTGDAHRPHEAVGPHGNEGHVHAPKDGTQREQGVALQLRRNDERKPLEKARLAADQVRRVHAPRLSGHVGVHLKQVGESDLRR